MAGETPITSYFSRVPKRKKKENTLPPRKRKKHDTDSELYRPPSQKAKGQPPAKSRLELRDRTSSFNKLAELTSPSISTADSSKVAASPQTPPYLKYATPKSLMRHSGSQSNTSTRSELNVIDLTVQSQADLDALTKDGQNVFLPPSDSTHCAHASSKPLAPPLTPSSSPLMRLRNPSTFALSQPSTESSSLSSQTTSAQSTTLFPSTPVRPVKKSHANIEIVPETPENSSPTIEKNMSNLNDQLPSFSQVPSSQSQEVEACWPPADANTFSFDKDLGVDIHPPEVSQSQEESLVIPSSQSQEVLLCDVSPRQFKRRIDCLKQMYEEAHHGLADIVPSSQSQIEHELGPLNQASLSSLKPSSLIPSDASPDGLDTTIHDEIQYQPLREGLQRSDSNDSFIVPMEDLDILSMFEDDDILQGAGFGPDDACPAEAILHDQATSVTESESADEGCMLPHQRTDINCLTRPPSPSQTPSEVHSAPTNDMSTQVYPEETQSWQSDVSAYSLPQVAKDFFAMLEKGPDSDDY